MFLMTHSQLLLNEFSMVIFKFDINIVNEYIRKTFEYEIK